MIDNKRVENLLKMGFIFQENDNQKLIYKAKYNDYLINTFTVDFSKKSYGEIYWGEIEKNVKNRRSSNLSKPEFLAQLYWVIKIIESGYSPNKVIIEQEVQLGRKSGYIDLIILDEQNIPFLILDIKSYGKEYENELRKLKKAKGQVISYYRYDHRVKYIGVATAGIINNFVNDETYIVSSENWNGLGSTDNLSDTLDTNEILENSFRISPNVSPYEAESIDLYPGDLIELTEQSSSKMFHKFLTILRKHGISDKTNAFNRVLNLFIAKIVDEFDTLNNQKLKFQILNNETDEHFIAKLENLYSKGMRDFIEINIDSDKEQSRINQIISENITNDYIKNELLKIIGHTKSKTSSNFHFKDVYDDVTFGENISLVKELVNLIAPYKLKYPKKQQFLGDFFEMILSNGFKQEAGQFFTPVPIARFMVNSLPLENMIKEKLENASPNNLLPKIIDFASGSGHFLTEYMDEIQKIINELDISNISQSSKNKINSFKASPFDWANNYVYGVDIDYRLVKTSKVSTFLNGDGNANIYRANGLDSFTSEDFKGDLHLNIHSTKNEIFDVLLANPPYHIDEFRQLLPNMDDDFLLAKYVTDNSSEIEALFIERASQLLKTGGVMGIILPSSILNTGNKIYTEARKLLLRNFKVIAIVKNPNTTFMATGTETVIIFAEKRSVAQSSNIEKQINDSVENLTKKTINEDPNFLENYANNLYQAELNEYIDFVNGYYVGDNIYFEDYYDKYQRSKKEYKDFKEFAWESEKEKMMYYALTNNEVILVQSPKKKAEEELLLGYKFSDRRGQEGIQPRVKNYFIEELSMLYGNNGNFINKIIKNAFLNKSIIPESNVEPFYSKSKLNQNIHFNANDTSFKIRIAYEGKKLIGYESEETISLSKIANLKNGTSISEKDIEIGEIPVIAGGRTPAYYSTDFNRKGDIITVSQSGAYAGYIAYHSTPIFASDSFTIEAKKDSPYTTEQIYILLKEKQNEIYKFASGSIQKHVYSEDLENFRLPMPSDEKELKHYINQISDKAKEVLTIENKIEEIQNYKSNVINSNAMEFFKEKNETLNKFHNKNILMIKGGKRIPKELDYAPFKTNHYYPGTGDFEYESINLETSNYIDEMTFSKIKNYQLLSNDIYISAAGTIGKVGKIPELEENQTISLTENAHRIRVIDESIINQDYLMYILSSDIVQKRLIEETVGVGTPKLSIDSLKNVKVPIIELSKQKEFVEKIYTINKDIENLYLKLNKLK